MNPRSALLVALLAGGLALQPGSPTAPSDGKKKTPSAGGADTSVSYERKLEIEDWPRETLHQFLATPAEARKESREAVCSLGAGYHVDFLIATVPDPQNSHYPYMFDRFMESIERAQADNGYTLDRFWLPWGVESGLADADWLKREQYSDWQSRKQEFPGILVFRHGAREVTSVLLVGENPVAGINKQQFDNALELMGHFNGPLLGTVKVLGPAFSGSIHSLGIAMRTLTRNKRNQDRGITGYRVITGSATGSHNQASLEAYHEAGKPAIRYSATVENDAVALDRFLNYLEDKSKSSGRVAILAEEGSGYAEQFIENKQRAHPPLILRYPMELARLRNAYQDDSELNALSNHTAGIPREGLHLTLKDSHAAQDSIPGFSPDLSPVSQEAALLNMLAIIDRQRIEYAGIVASDILDAIFLSRMLKQHCPDLRLFIVNSDLLYAGVAQNRAFQGMLMVTTYPLFAVNQIWTGSWNMVRPLNMFSSASGEGVYNACLRLLTDDEPVGPLAEYAPPAWDTLSPKFQPALWVSVVGRSALWPLTTLPATSVDHHETSLAPVKQTLRRRGRAHRAPMGWSLASYFFTLLSGAFAFLVWRFNRQPDDGVRVQRRMLSMFQVAQGNRLAVRAALTLAGVAMLVPSAMLTATQIGFQACYATLPGEDILRMAQAGSCVLGLVLILAAIVWSWQLPAAWWIGFAPACIAGPVYFCLWAYRQESLTVPYVYRTMHLGNGVSPLVPVVLLSAALFWYACVQLNRSRLCRIAPAGLPSFKGDIYLGGTGVRTRRGSVGQAYARLSVALDSIWFGSWAGVAAAIWLVSLVLWLLTSTHVRSLESRVFEKCYSFGLFIVYGTLLLACARFLHVWLGLRDVLQMIEQHPIRKALRRLGREKDLSPSAVWRWGGSRRTDMTLVHSIERLKILTEQRVIRPLGDWREFDYEMHLRVLERNARLVIAADGAGNPVKAAALQRINTTLDTVANHLVANLIAVGRERSVPVARQAAAVAVASAAAHAPVPMPAPPNTTDIAEEFVALRFVAIIRYVTLHMKQLLEFVAGGLVLAIASLVCYPFEPHHLIMTVISTCFFAMSGVFLFAFVQMNRNTIISYLSGTKPGKLDGNLLHVVSFGALPLVTVLSAQFPSIGGFLFAWVKPALETMH